MAFEAARRSSAYTGGGGSVLIREEGCSVEELTQWIFLQKKISGSLQPHAIISALGREVAFFDIEPQADHFRVAASVGLNIVEKSPKNSATAIGQPNIYALDP